MSAPLWHIKRVIIAFDKQTRQNIGT